MAVEFVDRREVREALGRERKASLVLGAGVVLMGLLAGLFYAFACGAMPALRDS